MWSKGPEKASTKSICQTTLNLKDQKQVNTEKVLNLHQHQVETGGGQTHGGFQPKKYN